VSEIKILKDRIADLEFVKENQYSNIETLKSQISSQETENTDLQEEIKRMTQLIEKLKNDQNE
jgi:uncharacterized coiled-coil protein SlyX